MPTRYKEADESTPHPALPPYPEFPNSHVALRATEPEALGGQDFQMKTAQRAAAASSDHILKKFTVVVSVWCRCGVLSEPLRNGASYKEAPRPDLRCLFTI